MNWIASTLWDLLKPAAKPPGPFRPVSGGTAKPAVRLNPVVRPTRQSVQERYDSLVVEMKRTHGVKVRKWRKSSSGVAWIIRYRGGREVKLIEAPYPRGPMSCAIFLHEIGHHAIGLGIHKPRCLEEYVVWMWALEQMRQRGFNVTEAVERRVERSMRYAVAKARRRGLQRLPEPLLRYA